MTFILLLKNIFILILIFTTFTCSFIVNIYFERRIFRSFCPFSDPTCLGMSDKATASSAHWPAANLILISGSPDWLFRRRIRLILNQIKLTARFLRAAAEMTQRCAVRVSTSAAVHLLAERDPCWCGLRMLRWGKGGHSRELNVPKDPVQDSDQNMEAESRLLAGNRVVIPCQELRDVGWPIQTRRETGAFSVEIGLMFGSAAPPL